MIVLGIDPGIAITGYGLVQLTGSSFSCLSYGTIRTKAHTPLGLRLEEVFKDCQDLLTRFSPHAVAIEELFFNTNAKTALTVGQARGVLLLAAQQFGVTIATYTPPQVKMAVCGYGHAQKHQVQYMVQKLLGLSQKPRPDDAADALAIAICHGHSYKIKSMS